MGSCVSTLEPLEQPIIDLIGRMIQSDVSLALQFIDHLLSTNLPPDSVAQLNALKTSAVTTAIQHVITPRGLEQPTLTRQTN